MQDHRGTERHSIKAYNMNGESLSSFQPTTAGFMQQARLPPISAVSFHPHRMMLAAGSLQDTHVNLYECHDSKGGTGFSLKENWNRIAEMDA